MSSLATAPEQSEPQTSGLLNVQRDLNIARLAYSKLKEYSYEEIKHLSHEIDHAEEEDSRACIKLLADLSLTCTEVDGEGLTGLINSLLQHATGNYRQSSFDDTDTILNSLVEEIRVSKVEALSREVIQETLQAVNQAMRTNLFLGILGINSRFKPEIEEEIGLTEGDPVVIWYNEGRYACIIPSYHLDMIQSDVNSEFISNDPLAIILQGYRAELQKFKLHIYDIANPLIARKILDALERVDSLYDQEGVLPHFFDIIMSKETLDALELLNNEIINLLMNNLNDVELVKSQVVGDLNSLSKDIDLDETIWEELKVLLEFPAIKEMFNIDIKKVKGYINKEDKDTLNEFLELKIKKEDIKEINSQLKENDFYDLRTLIAEIIENKPRKKEDLLSFWDRKEDFFKNKTFYLHHKDLPNTINGLIEQCTWRTPNLNLYFKLHNNTEIDIMKNTDSYAIIITTENCLPFWTAFKEKRLNRGNFEIRLPTNFEEYTSSTIYPGSYSIIKTYKPRSAYIQNQMKEMVYIKETKKCTEYCVSAIYNQNRGSFPTFEISNMSDRKKQNHVLQFSEFRKTYIAVLLETNHYIFDIRNIIIRDEIEGNQLKMKFLKEIHTELHLIRVEMSKEENKDLLNTLLDNFICNRMSKIDIEILHSNQREDLYKKLIQITKIYRNHLNNEKLPEDILKQVVIDANYARLVEKAQVLEVSKAMELIRKAYKYINEIRGKDILLFIGNTGSGKSSTIAYLLGAELELFYSKVGDENVKLKDEILCEEYPKIGQSLGESETLYTRGYYAKAQDRKLCPDLLTDCPGFNDTRGGHYELCTNLSIDQTIRECANIKAIVITVPIQAFMLDRSNPVLNLIESVVERFGDTFNADNPEGNRRLFLLITKSNQVSQAVVSKLRDGSRIEELYLEAEQSYRKLVESQEDDKYELEIAENKKKTWRVLLGMHESQQIDILDIRNKRQRIRLLEKYSKTEESINKASYLGLMKSPDMKIKFGKYIEMSTHTWTHLIFKNYLDVLPASIKASQDEIKAEQLKIQSLEEEKVARKKRIEDLKEDADTIQVQLKKLDSSNLDLSQDISIEILEKFKSECARLEKEIPDNEAKLKLTIEEISKLESKCEKNRSNIEENLNEIFNLSTGTRTDVLYEEDYRGKEREIIEIYRHENKEASAALEEFLELEDTGELSTKGKANCIKGVIKRVKVIGANYRLVPSDPEFRREFENNLKYISGNAKYEANIDGEGYRLIKCKANGDGRKIAYHFELKFNCRWYHWLTWKDPMMPWIKIAHEIPNSDYNEAALINRNAILNQLLREQSEITVKLGGIERNKGKYIKKKKLELKMKELKIKKEVYDEQLKMMESTYYIQFLNRRLEEILKEIEQLTCSTEIEEEVEIHQQEMVRLEEKLCNTRKIKKYFAIIVRGQIGTASLIREFAQIMCTDEDIGNVEITDETVMACADFIKVFDASIHDIGSQAEQDLSL